ncbi:hypothetical protein Y919_02600 [Caloranaerobacter azorensis H53214]|uniref:Phage portal protein n=1 Tax=Caloranaerobacter azorensis H53214 TaxID=1156417 RepID=A0A096CWZ6_9FIRM|nr:phage portal protein [Caloranaerobacter azorensis]KGG81074.1 hypothetical protein Y919_02600 [Caloranaerobacter azorensis H53214]
MIDYQLFLKAELEGLYGSQVLKDMKDIIALYDFYEGKGQDWTTPIDLDYKPTKIKTNKAKKLIKEEARFMFSRTPEITIKALEKKDEEKAKKLQSVVDDVLKKSKFPDKLIKAARDCFIGKRVALKLNADKNKGIKVIFRPSLEFIYETDPEDVDNLQKIIFFYGQNDSENKSEQRIWKQVYWLQNNKCYLTEGVYDGYGNLVESIKENEYIGIDFIPCTIIVNDGLTGDMNGESDIEELRDNQNIYNRLKSDDVDALKFNMFPERVAINASENSLKNLKIAPGALVDLQTDPTSENQADYKTVESKFSYDSRFENTINRINNDMYDLLNVPNISLEQLKGLMQSGKSMKALYWQLITRCNEKWAVWGPALEWMVEKIIILYKTFVDKTLDIDFGYSINIELLYALPEDDETERINDLAEVSAQVRSRRSYIEKWGIAEDSEEELQQIAKEQALLQDSFIGGVNHELGDEKDEK